MKIVEVQLILNENITANIKTNAENNNTEYNSSILNIINIEDEDALRDVDDDTLRVGNDNITDILNITDNIGNDAPTNIDAL